MASALLLRTWKSFRNGPLKHHLQGPRPGRKFKAKWQRQDRENWNHCSPKPPVLPTLREGTTLLVHRKDKRTMMVLYHSPESTDF